MLLASWNVNGLRAAVKKGFADAVADLDADVIGIQETKLQEGQIELELPGYHQYWSYAARKGYSGTAVFTRVEPLRVLHGFTPDNPDGEGRICALEFGGFWFVCVYSPNARSELARIGLRLEFETRLRAFVSQLAQEKPVVLCGDLNVAHQEIDLKNPGPNRGNPGFSDEEREAFGQLLGCGFTDTFRYFYPEVTGAYSWWSYRFNARANNAGWRIDYFVVSDDFVPHLVDAGIRPDIYGSDHCPVTLKIDL